MVFTYFLNDSGIIPVVPIITGITLDFTFHKFCIIIIIIIIIIRQATLKDDVLLSYKSFLSMICKKGIPDL
jgi:hypothetical protein